MTEAVSAAQARRFILLKQGLLGDYQFEGKEGIMRYIRQAGCIQFDPVDVCGQNAQLVLGARVKRFRREQLEELLYTERKLIDFFDKQLSIMPTEDWKYFRRFCRSYEERLRSHAEVRAAEPEVTKRTRELGCACSKDLGMDEKVDWYWSPSKLSRATLEAMYYQGKLVIHHKQGTQKYYSLAEDLLPEAVYLAEDPCPDDVEHFKWRVMRRIGAVGMLWNRASDAWLGMEGFRSPIRSKVFKELESEGKICPVQVDRLPVPLYCLTEDIPLLKLAKEERRWRERTEFLAPLDCFLWDRRLIKELFGFDYKWEIYTPAEQRRFGPYTLPILSGEKLVGRIQMICDRKADTLYIERIWLEDGVRDTKKLAGRIRQAWKRLARFQGCSKVVMSPEIADRDSYKENKKIN